MATFIQDKQLRELAKALNNEVNVVIDDVAYSEDATPANNNVTNFGTEIGNRTSITRSRTSNSVLIETVRGATDVVNTGSGDNLKRVMFVDSGSSAPLVLATFPNILHTTGFDLSIQLELEVIR